MIFDIELGDVIVNRADFFNQELWLNQQLNSKQYAKSANHISFLSEVRVRLSLLSLRLSLMF